MSKKKTKKVFVQGAISPEKIAASIASHQSKTGIGAHSIFLGQVRADKIDGKEVIAIDYSAYEEMADKEFHAIREAAFSKFDLACAHIYHSLGVVKAGEVCLFVFTSSEHRKPATDACHFIVEELKSQGPHFRQGII
jgi:molybdopterin synthase catalytic subunit